MTHLIEPGCLSRSFTIGFIALLFSTGLVACGPGPEESAASGGQSFVQGEPISGPTATDRKDRAIQSIATIPPEENP
jgi:hypothetical protein